MVKRLSVAFAFTIAFCALAVPGLAHGEAKEEFVVSGMAYCDTCRVGFQTKLSYFLSGAKIGLECFNETTKKVSFKTETVSNDNGRYHIKVPGDHEEDICEVTLLSSSHPQCNHVLPGSIRSDRVSLTNKNGVFGYTRFANVLSFATTRPHPACTKVLLDMGVLPEELDPTINHL